MPTLQSIADAYDVAATRFSRSRTTTLAECVPLLDVALEFIDRGPAELTIEAIESYRESAIRLLENMRPVIERQAKATLAAWQQQVGEVIELRAAA
jgi:hypothetical protein